MSRKKWLIVAALALANLIVLCMMAMIVVRSMRSANPSSPSTGPTPTATETIMPTVTLPPTWTPTFTPSPRPSPTTESTSTPTETPTPWSTSALTTSVITTTPTVPPVSLENPSFDGITGGDISGWQTGAFVNWSQGEPFDPAVAFAEPRFQKAIDPRQQIDGSTLQISTEPWVKLQAWVFQTVGVQPGSQVTFQVNAMGFVRELNGGYILKAGVDPDGDEGCENAQWGTERIVNQEDGVIKLTSPEVTVGEAGQATVCMFAETQFAQVYHAAFFDAASITVQPPEAP